MYLSFPWRSTKRQIPLLHGDTVDMQATDDGMVVSITKIEYSRHERGDKTDICHQEYQTVIGARGQRRSVWIAQIEGDETNGYFLPNIQFYDMLGHCRTCQEVTVDTYIH